MSSPSIADGLMHDSYNRRISGAALARLLMLTILLISIAQSVWFFKNRAYDYTDGGLANYPKASTLYSSFFLWSQSNYTGLMGNLGSIIGDVIYSTFLALVWLFGNIFGTELYFGLLLAIGNLGMFFLVYSLLDGHGEAIRVFSSFMGMAIFSFYLSLPNGPGFNVVGVFLPCAVLFALRLSEGRNPTGRSSTGRAPFGFPLQHTGLLNRFRYRDFALLTVSVAGLLALGNGAYAIQNLSVVLLLMLFLVAYTERSFRKQLFLLFALSVCLAALMDFSMIYGQYAFTHAVEGQFFNNSSYWIIQRLNKQSIFDALQLHNAAWQLLAAQLLIFTVAVLSVLAIPKLKRSAAGLTVGILVSSAVLLFFWANYSAPFGPLFLYLIGKFPILLVFRYSGSSLYYLMFFTLGTLFAMGSAFIMGKVGRRGAVAFALLILCGVAVRVYYMEYVPQIGYTGITIPQYVFQVSDFINSQHGYFNVALLPAESPFMHFSTWYNGTDVYTYLINAPAFTGGYVAASELFFPASSGLYYAAAWNIGNMQVNSPYIAEQFGNLSIKYIILQKDSNNLGDTHFNIDRLQSNLNNAVGLRLVRSFNYTDIYELNTTAPIISANASITGFSFADPTRVYVTVNATQPFDLVFRESYDPRWAAYYPNGTAVNGSQHTMVGGYANSWHIQKIGNYTMELYYTPQTMAWVSWAISGAAMAALSASWFVLRKVRTPKISRAK